MNRSRFAFVVGTAAPGLSTLTACGGGGPDSSGQSSTSQSAPASSQPAGASVKLATAQAHKLGTAVGTVSRADGSKQLTLGGLPLYQFANDTKAGDVKGQALGGIWWVVGPDGKKITTQVSDSGNNGY
ncbi:MAG: hypothetical protein QOH50_4370 [Kribbellaceae bacterium]|nr:hypothetical protein [Kribbellaceae bacterium]